MIFEMGILSARRVGFLLAFVWLGIFCYIWLPDNLPDFLKHETKSSTPSVLHFQAAKSSLNGSGDVVHVCITSDKNTIGGMVTLMNSIVSNTRSHVKFHLVVDEKSVDHLNIWLMTSKLKNANFEIKPFPESWVEGKISLRGERKELASPLNYARFYLPKLFPLLKEKIVFLDDDCLVQGDIRELYNTHIKEGHLGAFSEDCHGVNKRLSRLANVYAEYLYFRNPHVQEMKIKPTACSFNTGVFVTDLRDWDKYNITGQLEHWMELNSKEEVYGRGGSGPPMMIVFYNKHSEIDPMWHVRSLGMTSGTSYSKGFVSKAKLLHWNGRFKPWGRVSQHSDVWERFYIPDPENKFQLVRRT